MYELKIYRGVMCHDTEEWCNIWRGTDLYFQNCQRNLTNFDLSTQKSKMCTLMGSFWTKYIVFDLKKYRKVMLEGTEDWTKYIMFDLKKYRRVMSHYTEKWSKIWRKTDFYFKKWHEEFGKFSQAEKQRFHLRK